MKIRGESGSMPARMGGGAGGVSRGGKVLNRVKANVKDKLEDSKVANKIANTKPVVKATKAVAKKVQASKAAKGKKAVNTIADSADKARAAQIAKNSVKTVRPTPQGNKMMNDNAAQIAKLRKSGELAKRAEKNVVTKKMGTVKINSAPKKDAPRNAKKAGM